MQLRRFRGRLGRGSPTVLRILRADPSRRDCSHRHKIYAGRNVRVGIKAIATVHSQRRLWVRRVRFVMPMYVRSTPICGTAPEASAFSNDGATGTVRSCPASHEGFSVKSRVRVQVEALLLQAFRCKPHIRQDDVPPLSFIRTKELQAGGTTLFERRLSAKPDNGAAPLNL
jgi:hypothetical protein